MENKTYTATVTELKDGGLAIPLHASCFEVLDLQEGDRVKYTPIGDGFSISKWDGQLELFFDVEEMLGEIVEMEKKHG
jgi:hypothetical protein